MKTLYLLLLLPILSTADEFSSDINWVPDYAKNHVVKQPRMDMNDDGYINFSDLGYMRRWFFWNGHATGDTLCANWMALDRPGDQQDLRGIHCEGPKIYKLGFYASDKCSISEGPSLLGMVTDRGDPVTLTQHIACTIPDSTQFPGRAQGMCGNWKQCRQYQILYEQKQ